MNLQQLNTLYINEGTESNPFILTDREVDTLYRISVQADAEKHQIAGWVNTESGSIPSYIKHYLENKFTNLHVLATGTSSQDWTVDFVSHSINEGSATKMVVTNLTTDSLDYTVTVESLQVTSGIYNETQVLQHFHVDTAKGEVSYDKPTSDAGWVASLAVKFKPSYITDPTQEDYRTVRINVVAVAVSSIEILAEDYVGLNGQTEIRVRALPINNTKESEDHKIYLSVTGGGYAAPNQLSGLTGSAVYYAPASGNEVTISAELHMFGASAVYAAASKIVALRALVKAVIQEKTGANPVELKSAYIIITAPDGTTTNLKNGETMMVVADGSTTYTVECVETDNYSGVVDKATITPTDALTIVTATYSEKIYGFTFFFDDDSVEMADDYYDGDNIKSDASTQSRVRNHLVALGVRNSNCAFIIPFEWIDSSIRDKGESGNYMNDYKYLFTREEVVYVFDGDFYTRKFVEYDEGKGINPGIFKDALEKRIVIGGVERTGYIPAYGELASLPYQELNKYINQVLIFKGKKSYPSSSAVISCNVYGEYSFMNHAISYPTNTISTVYRNRQYYIIEVCKY